MRNVGLYQVWVYLTSLGANMPRVKIRKTISQRGSVRNEMQNLSQTGAGCMPRPASMHVRCCGDVLIPPVWTLEQLMCGCTAVKCSRAEMQPRPSVGGVALQQLGSWFSHLREPERASKPAKQQPCPYALRTETRERERERIESYRPM